MITAFDRVGRGVLKGCALLSVLGVALLATVGGCPAPSSGGPPVFNNTTDATNGGATYIGSAACSACHPSVAETFFVHGHSQALKRIQGVPPAYPSEGVRAGVPNPPTGKTWLDISYVIGGYLLGANFVGSDGFLLADGTAGVNTQWNLTLPDNGTTAGLVAFMPEVTQPQPYTYDCFRCHTTGPGPFGPANPQTQDNRPGILGTWTEPGVRCEACHGPGSNHIPNPSARALFVDPTPLTCARCHLAGNSPNVILATDGFIATNTQYAELRASGGHANFACTTCHDPHVSAAYSDAGLRNTCTVCHADVNMALHEGKVLTRGGFTEPLECQSCHMPYATRTASVATPEVVGPVGRMADTRTHIFRINANSASFADMFAPNGSSVLKDAEGRAAVTVDFVCLRCHNGIGSAFELTVDRAAEIAGQMHKF